VEVTPGELAEVDFGPLGLVWDPQAGRRRLHHALVVTLVHSRHQYFQVSPSQKIEELIEGPEGRSPRFPQPPAGFDIVPSYQTLEAPLIPPIPREVGIGRR
jgi:hypothetical protein